MKTERPYVICHMISSLDGKIDGDYFDMPEILEVRNASNKIREQFNCNAVIYGAVTMADTYAEGYIKNLPASPKHCKRENHIADSEVQNFFIVIDPQGSIKYDSKYIEKRGRPKSHIVVALTESVSDGYINYLRNLDISYIFAGKNALNYEKLMRTLKNELKIERVILSGGGIVNWTFLQAGMIDELSIIICPATDGSRNVATIFDRSLFSLDDKPISFNLIGVQTLPGNGIWLKYIPKS